MSLMSIRCQTGNIGINMLGNTGMILNLAGDGNWTGNPDETTNFDEAKFMIDSVRIYQKEFYDENVEKKRITSCTNFVGKFYIEVCLS